MPPAILIPVAAMVATTAFSAINQNVQNKAANKNNLNQQQGEVDYANSLRQKAMNWTKANPPPTQGMSVHDQTLRGNGTAPAPPPAQAAPPAQSPAVAAPNTFGAPRANLSPGGQPAGVQGGAGVANLIQAILRARGQVQGPAGGIAQ